MPRMLGEKKKKKTMNKRDRDGNRPRERYYIVLMRSDPITVWEGVKSIHSLLGVCPVLPSMALAVCMALIMPGTQVMSHVLFLPPGSRDYSTQVRPLPLDVIGNAGQHISGHITDLPSPWHYVCIQKSPWDRLKSFNNKDNENEIEMEVQILIYECWRNVEKARPKK